MRLLVCGGRDFSDYDALGDALQRVVGQMDAIIIHGGARGADSLAQKWADHVGHMCRVFPADWGAHGKAAGPIRNQLMLDEGKPDLVIAFPGGRGTADMVRRARKAGVEVREVSA